MATTFPSLKLRTGEYAGIERDELTKALRGLQELIFSELGLIIPILQVVDDETLPKRVQQLEINDSKLERISGLEPNEFWVNVRSDAVVGRKWWNRNWEARPAIEPNTGDPAATLRGDEAGRQLWQSYGYDTRSPLGYIVFTTAAELRRHAATLLTPDLVRYYLVRLKGPFPALVQAARRFDVESLTRVLQAKLEQRMSIRNLRRILETMLAEAV